MASKLVWIRSSGQSHHCSSSNDGSVSNGHACLDDRLVANPHIVSDDNITLVVPGFGHLTPVQSPRLKKDGKGIGFP